MSDVIKFDDRKSSITSIGSGGFPERRTRRQSMFAVRPFCQQPNTRGHKRVVTCIPQIIRFRRAVKIVRILCKVFSIRKKDLHTQVTDSNWVALTEALLNETNVQLNQKQTNKAGEGENPTNETSSKQTFDISKFRVQHSKIRESIPIKLREIMEKSPHLRTADENLQILRRMRKLETFSRYPVEVQKAFTASGWMEEYDVNRVIILKGHTSSCLYFVISGRLVSNGGTDEGSETVLLKKGDKFGEDDIISDELRHSTVVSQEKTRIFVVHKKDYLRIMKDIGAKDVGILDICRNISVFHHWPLEKLKENPFLWNIQNYKEGSLVAEDSSHCDWLYVIKSGSCKVIKRIRAYRGDDDDNDVTRKSVAREARHKLMEMMMSSSSSNLHRSKETKLSPMSKIFFTTPSRPQTCSTFTTRTRASTSRSRPRSSFLSSIYGEKRDQTSYVALEVLGPGESFGFRSVLPTDQRGPSVSLVSCGAEIIHINRKFFRKFADETTCSLIEMQFPPFPNRDVILRHLRQLHEWDEYKRNTLDTALRHHRYLPRYMTS